MFKQLWAAWDLSLLESWLHRLIVVCGSDILIIRLFRLMMLSISLLESLTLRKFNNINNLVIIVVKINQFATNFE